MTVHTVVPSPIGPLLLTGDGDVLTGLYLDTARLDPALADGSAFPAVRAQLAAYFAGERTAFDVPLAPSGTPFQLRVWEELRAIPYGRTTTYGAIARRLGSPNASRAVGLANGRNPISVIVPCHRVIGADGSLTGYGGGLDRKRRLLELEASVLTLTR